MGVRAICFNITTGVRHCSYRRNASTLQQQALQYTQMLLFRSSYRSSTPVAFRSAFETQTWNVNGFRWRAARATEKCRPLSRPTSNGSGAAGAAPVDFCRTRTTSHGPTQHHLSQHSLCQTSTTSAGPVHSSLGRATGRAHRIPPLQQPGLLFLASGLPASAACRQEGCEEGNAL